MYSENVAQNSTDVEPIPLLKAVSQEMARFNDRQREAIIDIKSKLFQIINQKNPDPVPVQEKPPIGDFEQDINYKFCDMRENTNELESLVYFLDKIV